MPRTINKTMDRKDLELPEALSIVEELNSLITSLQDRKLKIGSWWGTLDLNDDVWEKANRGYGYIPLENAADDKNFPWFLYWEIVWLVINNDFRPGETILDLGGSSSLFSYYLASKGLDVTTIDLQEDLVDNANHVAGSMGWELKNCVKDMRRLDFETEFDHITSVSVYVLMPAHERIQINRTLKDLLSDGGTFSVTFDYRNPYEPYRIASSNDLYEQFITPSGLAVRGNENFYDNHQDFLLHPFYANVRLMGWRRKLLFKREYIGSFGLREIFTTKDANDYTFGALFLQKAF